MAMTKGQLKPVGILPFNLSEFINVSPLSTMKLTFAKCFDPKAAIFVSTHKEVIDQNNDHFETESNATMETISDNFSEFGNNSFAFEKKAVKPNHASFATTEGTTPSSYIGSETRSASFISNTPNERGNNSARGQKKIDFNKDKLQIQKLNNEVSHYKTLLSEHTAKQQDLEAKEKENNEIMDKQKGILEEKDNLIKVLRQEVKQKQEEFDSFEQAQQTEKHKLKMKLEYLTNKCFQLNCQLDKKDFKTEKKDDKEDLSMLVDIIEKKQKEY